MSSEHEIEHRPVSVEAANSRWREAVQQRLADIELRKWCVLNAQQCGMSPQGLWQFLTAPLAELLRD